MSRSIPGAAGKLLTHPAGWIATGFGSGLAPVAPGTFGTAAALLPWLAMRDLPLGTAYAVWTAVILYVADWPNPVSVRVVKPADPLAPEEPADAVA